MRGHRLFIRAPGFKNLSDFLIEFGEASPMTVLVGRYGTGKSNVLDL